MGHTSREKSKLLGRVRRIRGQVEALERSAGLVTGFTASILSNLRITQDTACVTSIYWSQDASAAIWRWQIATINLLAFRVETPGIA